MTMSCAFSRKMGVLPWDVFLRMVGGRIPGMHCATSSGIDIQTASAIQAIVRWEVEEVEKNAITRAERAVIMKAATFLTYAFTALTNLSMGDGFSEISPRTLSLGDLQTTQVAVEKIESAIGQDESSGAKEEKLEILDAFKDRMQELADFAGIGLIFSKRA